MNHIAVLPGDGIGEEVMAEAIKVLRAIQKRYGLTLRLEQGEVGGAAYDKHGTALPEETISLCDEADAILFGSVGGPAWDELPPKEKIERVALLGLRKRYNLYCNLRPAILYKPLVEKSPLKEKIAGDGFNILIVRELTSGIYFGKKILSKTDALDEMRYTKKEVARIAKLSFELALLRKRKVTCVDKANVLATSILFRNTVREVANTYKEVDLDFLYIDNATMQLLKRPQDFDIIVTTNMFGDILSDEAAMLTGSIGMLPSASLNQEKFGMYEPAGGSAPDIAGKGIANPIAQVLSAAMMLRHTFQLEDAARDIERAVISLLESGYRTKDIMEQGMQEVSTKEMGNLLTKELQ